MRVKQCCYESGPVDPKQIGRLCPTSSDPALGLRKPFGHFLDIVAPTGSKFGGSDVVDSPYKRRVVVLWRHLFGILQGISDFGMYLHGNDSRSIARIPAPPKDWNAEDKNVVLVDERVPLGPLCALLGIEADCRHPLPEPTDRIYWARITETPVERAETLSKLVTTRPSQDSKDMNIAVALSAYVQLGLTTTSSQGLLLLGSYITGSLDDGAGDVAELIFDSRGKARIWWNSMGHSLQPSRDRIGTVEIAS